MATELAVLLRNCKHSQLSDVGSNTTTGRLGYALKIQQISIQIAKTPIQIPIPQSSPELIDIGIFRPSINLTGIIDDIGGDPTTTHTNVEGMERISHTRSRVPDGDATAKQYYIPYKNKLENTCYSWIASGNENLELEIGDASYPEFASSTNSTGGGVYYVAIQQARFQLDAAKEDRWEFTMQFVTKSRYGAGFSC